LAFVSLALKEPSDRLSKTVAQTAQRVRPVGIWLDAKRTILEVALPARLAISRRLAPKVPGKMNASLVLSVTPIPIELAVVPRAPSHLALASVAILECITNPLHSVACTVQLVPRASIVMGASANLQAIALIVQTTRTSRRTVSTSAIASNATCVRPANSV